MRSRLWYLTVNCSSHKLIALGQKLYLYSSHDVCIGINFIGSEFLVVITVSYVSRKVVYWLLLGHVVSCTLKLVCSLSFYMLQFWQIVILRDWVIILTKFYLLAPKQRLFHKNWMIRGGTRKMWSEFASLPLYIFTDDKLYFLWFQGQKPLWSWVYLSWRLHSVRKD